MGHLSEFEVGLITAIPWLCAICAMYVTGRLSDRSGRRRPFLIGALLFAAAGMYLATIGSPVFALAALCVAAMGFKTSSPMFWTIPQDYLHPDVSAPAIALVNSLGNLGGFVAPAVFGVVEARTGSTTGGLLGLSAVSVVAAASVLLLHRPDRGGGHSAARTAKA
jgi:nitrate/nitrite transporter NarK